MVFEIKDYAFPHDEIQEFQGRGNAHTTSGSGYRCDFLDDAENETGNYFTALKCYFPNKMREGFITHFVFKDQEVWSFCDYPDLESWRDEDRLKALVVDDLAASTCLLPESYQTEARRVLESIQADFLDVRF